MNTSLTERSEKSAYLYPVLLSKRLSGVKSAT
jgi:hypothetical protein